MGLPRHLKTKYDAKECWDVYHSWGAAASWAKLNEWYFQTKGIVPSNMGPYCAAWRWACKNAEEAYPTYKQWLFETTSNSKDGRVIDPNITFEEFVKVLKAKADRPNILSPRAKRQFYQKWGLQ